MSEQTPDIDRRLGTARASLEALAQPDAKVFTCPHCQKECSLAAVFKENSVDKILGALRKKMASDQPISLPLKVTHLGCSAGDDDTKKFVLTLNVSDDDAVTVTVPGAPQPAPLDASLDGDTLGDAEAGKRAERKRIISEELDRLEKAEVYRCPYCEGAAPLALPAEEKGRLADAFLQGEPPVTVELPWYLHGDCPVKDEKKFFASVALRLTFDGTTIEVAFADPVRAALDEYARRIDDVVAERKKAERAANALRDALGQARTVFPGAPANIRQLDTDAFAAMADELGKRIADLQRELDAAIAARDQAQTAATAAGQERDVRQQQLDAIERAKPKHPRRRAAGLALAALVALAGSFVGGRTTAPQSSSDADAAGDTASGSGDTAKSVEAHPSKRATVSVTIHFPISKTPMLRNPEGVVTFPDGSQAKIVQQELIGTPAPKGARVEQGVRFHLVDTDTRAAMVGTGTVSYTLGAEEAQDVAITAHPAAE